jgi:secreted Zn-dependent insulinase-like peptidase
VWAAAVNEPFFKVLRTEQQLGYLVNSGLRNNDGVATFVLVVQSSKYGVDLIQMRMASFMASAEKEVLEKLSASDVVALAKSESDKRKMRDKRLIQQVSYSNIRMCY